MCHWVEIFILVIHCCFFHRPMFDALMSDSYVVSSNTLDYLWSISYCSQRSGVQIHPQSFFSCGDAFIIFFNTRIWICTSDLLFKAVLLLVFAWTHYFQMGCYIYCSTLQVLSALCSALVSFSSLFWFCGLQLHCFCPFWQLFTEKKALIKLLYMISPTTNRHQVVNIVESLTVNLYYMDLSNIQFWMGDCSILRPVISA